VENKVGMPLKEFETNKKTTWHKTGFCVRQADLQTWNFFPAGSAERSHSNEV